MMMRTRIIKIDASVTFSDNWIKSITTGRNIIFNSQWLLHVGDIQGAEKNSFSDKDWKKVTLPHAFNEDEAFKVGIENMTDTISWYRKHFKLPKTAKRKKSVY